MNPKNGTSIHYREVMYTHECIQQKHEIHPGIFSKFFNADDTNDPTPTVHENEERNMQDIDIGTKLAGNFNVETGLWIYQAVSHHKPSKMMDTKLIQNTEDRNKYITSININESTGLYGSYDVKPAVVNPVGTPI